MRTFILLVAVVRLEVLDAFQAPVVPVRWTTKGGTQRFSSCFVKRNADDDEEKSTEYRNAATSLLSNFMSDEKRMNQEEQDDSNPLAAIDFDAPKLALDLETLAQALDAELYEKEWFVTGNVNPVYFADSFQFQDPDVKLSGIKDYAKGVNKLFDQKTARAEIISTKVNPDIGPNTITVTWRLSGKVNIGPGLNIKPYIVYTDFAVDDETGLIVFQEDRFAIPGWDILLSSLFPFLIGRVTSPPAPAPEPRDPPPRMPRRLGKAGGSPLDSVFSLFGDNK